MLDITPRVRIPDEDLVVRYARSGGPGGQNVNKVATKVELRLQLARTAALSPAVKRRLAETYPSYVTKAGEFVVTSARHRTQGRNRSDAEEKLVYMVCSVLTPPRRRKPTRVSRGAKRRRVDTKRRRGEVKRRRQSPAHDDW